LLSARPKRGQIGLVVGAIAGEEQAIASFGRAREDSEACPDPPHGLRDRLYHEGVQGVRLAEMASECLVDLEDPLDLHLPAGVPPPSRDDPITLADLAAQSAEHSELQEREFGSRTAPS
jgi:hypothetical protein